MMRFLLAILFLVVATAMPAREKQSLDAAAFLEKAVAHDPRFKALLAQRLDFQYREALRLPAGDWILGVAADYVADLGDPPVDPSASAAVSLSKLLVPSGTTLRLSASGDNLNQDLSNRAWTASISQDLAQNAFGRAARLDSKIAGLDVALAEHQLVEAWEDYLASLASLYVRWYLSWESLQTAENAAADAEKLLGNIRERRRRNVALRVDVDKVRLQVLDKQDRLLQLRHQWEAQAREIGRVTGMEDPLAFAPVNPQGNWKWDAAWVDAFEKDSRTVRLLETAAGLDTAQLRRIKDDLLPSLKAGVAYGGSQTGGADPAGDVTAFLNLDIPLGHQKERARAGQAEVSLQRRQAANQDSLGRAMVSLRNLAAEIALEDRRIELTLEKISLSERILKDENENYSYGRATLNDLIRFVQGLEDDRFALVQRQAARTVLVLEALRLSDRLVQRLPQ